MRGRGRRTIVTVALLASLAAAGAIAAVDPGDYRTKQRDALLPADAAVSAKVRCPKRHRAVPAGAFVHAESERRPDPALALNSAVPNSGPVKGGKAWRVGASNGPGEDRRLHLIAHCAPRGQVRGAEVVTERFEIASGSGGGTADCPGRTRVLTGGVLWHAPGSRAPVSQMLRTSSSTPVNGGRGWYGDGHNFGPAALELDVIALCIPKRRLGEVARESKDLTYPAYSEGFGGSVKCPGASRVLTGGASWHPEGEPADPEQALGTVVSSSAPTANAKRWYANGVNFIGPLDARLRITALCVAG